MSGEIVRSSPHVHPLYTCHLRAIYFISCDARSWVFLCVCATRCSSLHVTHCVWVEQVRLQRACCSTRGSRMELGISQTPTWAWSPRLKCCQCSADTHKRVFVCQSSALSGPVTRADNMSTPQCKDPLVAAPRRTGEQLI